MCFTVDGVICSITFKALRSLKAYQEKSCFTNKFIFALILLHMKRYCNWCSTADKPDATTVWPVDVLEQFFAGGSSVYLSDTSW